MGTNYFQHSRPVDILFEDGIAHDDPACKDDQHRNEKADQTLPTNPKLLTNYWIKKNLQECFSASHFAMGRSICSLWVMNIESNNLCSFHPQKCIIIISSRKMVDMWW